MFSVHQLWLLTRSRCVKHWRVPRSWPFLLRVSMHGSARFIWIGLQVLGNAIGRCGVELRGALKSGLAAGRSSWEQVAGRCRIGGSAPECRSLTPAAIYRDLARCR